MLLLRNGILSLDNQLLHPGRWLQVESPPDYTGGQHLQQGTPDLTSTRSTTFPGPGERRRSVIVRSHVVIRFP